MKLARSAFSLVVAIAIVVALFAGLNDPRDLGSLAGAALVAGAVLIAGSKIRGGMLGEFAPLYWLAVVPITVWAVSELERGGSEIAAGGLVAVAIQLAFERPEDEDAPEDEDD